MSKHKKTKKHKSNRRSGNDNTEVKTRLSYLLLSIVTLCFLITMIFITVQGNEEVNLAKRSANWPSVDGVIVESEMDSFMRRRRRNRRMTRIYVAQIAYAYTVGEQVYEAYPISIGDSRIESSRKEVAQLALDKYPLGEEVKVYYDPNHPETAVLESGVTSQNYGAWVTVTCGSIFILGLFIFFGKSIQDARRTSRLRQKRKRKSTIALDHTNPAGCR